VLGGNGEPFMINKTYIKFYPAEYHSQSAIDVALDLRPKLKNGFDDIDRITIETFNAAVEIIGGEPEKCARQRARPQITACPIVR